MLRFLRGFRSARPQKWKTSNYFFGCVLARRPVDHKGLYYFGKVLKAQGNSDRAREMFEQAIDSVKTSPHYRRIEFKRWSNLAKGI